MTTDHAILEELRQARKSLAAARIAEQDARTIVSERKAARMKAEALIEEICSEIETGRSGRPILDHINGRSGKGSERPEEEDESADERQRGPTVREPRITDHQSVPPAPRKRGQPHNLQAAERAEPGKGVNGHKPGCTFEAMLGAAALEWTSADLERELSAACGWTHPGTVWDAAREDGCDDAKILEILRAIWPVGYRVEQGTGPWKGRNGCTIHGGPTPAFWVGARKSTDWKIAPPQLQGLQLADRVRAVLGIPRVRIQPEPETAADRQPVRKRRGKEAASAL